ncbi:hypothetical protein [Spirosoma profusum]|nr:hypothetical protein [Spirosoma profusum]
MRDVADAFTGKLINPIQYATSQLVPQWTTNVRKWTLSLDNILE